MIKTGAEELDMAAEATVPAGEAGRKIHVLTVLHDLGFGGDESRALSFSRTMDREHFRHTVVTVNRPGMRRHPEMRAHYEAAGVAVLSLEKGSTGAAALVSKREGPGWRRLPAFVRGVTSGAQLVRRLAALARELDVDVLSAHNELATLIALPAAKLARKPVVLTSYYLESREESKLLWLLGQLTWSTADAVISDSRFAVDMIRDWTLVGPRRTEVIPNGVYEPPTRTSKQEARRLLGLPEGDDVTVVGQISRIVPVKGHLVLMEAVREVLDRRPDTWFAMVGFAHDPEYLALLQRRARELGVDHRLVLQGYGGHVGDIWPAIDVHVHASLKESLPIAIAEGMSLGKPAVVTDVAGTTEEVTDRVTGLVVPPGDASALARAVLELLDDPELARRLGAAARQRYLDGFQPHIMARRLEALYREVVAQHRRGRRADGASALRPATS